MAKIIQPCDSERGHFWRPVNERVSQCSRCGECATAEDFALTAAPAATPTDGGEGKS